MRRAFRAGLLFISILPLCSLAAFGAARQGERATGDSLCLMAESAREVFPAGLRCRPFSLHSTDVGNGSRLFGPEIFGFRRPVFGAAMPDEVHGPTSGPIDPARLWLVAGTMFTGNAAIMWYYFTTFYSPRESERSKWHAFDDWYNADLNVDKIGHVWGTQAYANTLYHIFRWTNMREEPAMWWSSSLAFFFHLQMEMTDAFYK